MERPDEETEPLWDELDLPEVAAVPVRAVSAFEEEGRPIEIDSIAALLGPSPVAVDDLVRQSGRPTREVQTALLELEVAGRLERHGGNAVSLLPPRPAE
jgi:DNA processing protein